MTTNTPMLFIEINFSTVVFVVGIIDDNQKFKIIEKIKLPSEGVEVKFINIDQFSKLIKDNLEIIEKKQNFIFKEITLILDLFDCSCINISGFKKLNGSQVLKENISYILNSLKLKIGENEAHKSILHIFNSKSILDGTYVENLPIGLFGDFYCHELTFFLIKNSDLKDIKQIFSKNNLFIKKILLKGFNDGVQLINENKDIDTFFRIKLNKDSSNISFFNKSSFKYSENFKFGTNIILRDIVKICSLENKIIRTILSNDFDQANNFSNNELIEEKYFSKGNYRKIRKKLILDVANARIKEITSLIFNKNINIESFKFSNFKIYITIEDEQILNCFKTIFKECFSNYNSPQPNFIKDFDIDSSFTTAANLSIYGWKKEAIPVTQTKNSLITRIFKSFFG